VLIRPGRGTLVTRQLGWPYKKDFACHRCGNCCRGDGYVEMTESDVTRAARYLGITDGDFIREYCLPGGDGRILKDQSDPERSCIFLIEENGLYGCRIHGAKPDQCAGFPFRWRPRNVMEFCEGMRALEHLPPPVRGTMSPAGRKAGEKKP
jgi:Fe-S-cluster containining protein